MMNFQKQDIKLAKSIRRAEMLRPFFPKMYERIMEKQAIKILNEDSRFYLNADGGKTVKTVKNAVDNMKSVNVTPNLFGTNGNAFRSMAVLSTPFMAFLVSAVEQVIQSKEAIQASQLAGGVVVAAYALLGPYMLWLIHKEKEPLRKEIGSALKKQAYLEFEKA